MSPQKTLLACITGQCVSLEAPKSAVDLEGRIARASRNYSPYPGINVLRVDRNRLLDLAEYLNSSLTFKIKVDGEPTELEVQGYNLISYHLIIVKVEGQKIMLHGIKEGREPWDGDDLDWENIKEANDYGWNLGTGTI